jgi:hypothetical protein
MKQPNPLGLVIAGSVGDRILLSRMELEDAIGHPD